MDLGANADGELLQRALDGERVTDPGILELVAVLHAVTAVDQSALAPRAEFVADLRARLLDDDGTAVLPFVPLPGTPDVDADPTSAPHGALPEEPGPEPEGRTDGGGTVSILRVASKPVRYLAAAAASILVVGGALGVASRSAAPGDALYAIKQVLDRAAVQLAGSRFDEGTTYLAQARQHIGEARDLVDRGTASYVDVDAALDAASDTTRRAQNILVDVYHSENRGDALVELSDYYTQAIPQVDALRDRVPPESRPAWQRLRDLLGQAQLATVRELASCVVCGDRAAVARDLLARLTSGAGTALPGSATGGATLPGVTPTLPGASVSVPGLPPAPSASLPPAPGLPGVSITGGVTLPGGTVNLPSVGLTSTAVSGGGGGITLPGSTVNLPTVGITSTAVVGGGGGVTLPGPLPTVSLPSVSLPLAPELP